MTVRIYRYGGLVSRSLRKATLIVELDIEPHELPYNLTRFARQHGGDFAEIVHSNRFFEELQTA